MSKYIKNISGSDIISGGKVISDQQFWELTGPNILKFAFLQKVLDQINNDEVLVSLDGSTTLSKSESLIAIRSIDFAENIIFDNSSNGYTALTTQDAIEETQNSIIGALDTYVFTENATASNKWLSYESDSIPSDETPAIIMFDSELVGISFTNDDNGSDTDIEIYKSVKDSGSTTSKIATFEIRNKRVAKFSNFTPIAIDSGDKISVFARDRGTNPSGVVVKLYFKVTNFNTENSGEDFSSDFSLTIGGITITIS